MSPRIASSALAPRQKRGTGPARARGIGLIEVLVSVLVLGIGLLGVAALQSFALRGGQSSLESSQGVMQATSIIEAMRGNRANVANYNIGMTCAVPTGGTLAQNDLRDWITDLKNTMGTAADSTTCGQIVCTVGTTDCVVTVRWDDARAGGGATREVATRTTI